MLIFCILCLTQSRLNMDVQLPLLGRINLENLVENVKAGEVKAKRVSKKLLSIEKALVRQAPVVLV